ncbi:MAG: hypothetical protein N2594_07820 [Clostridiales bacterium]|nr:hypothetical protein [Clostridiales bacterium]
MYKKFLIILMCTITLFLLFIYGSIKYYNSTQPIKLSRTMVISDRDNHIYPICGNFNYGIYNSGIFDIKIEDIVFNTSDVEIKSIGIKREGKITEAEYITLDDSTNFILNKKQEATIQLIANIKNKNSQIRSMKIQYKILGLSFKQIFYLETFSE